MDHLFIDIENPGRYYALFYFLAFLIGLVVLIREGQKREFPIVPWLMVITTAFLFFMAGSQAIKFSSADWLQVFRFEKLDHLPARSVLGGLLLVVPGLMLAKYALRFRHSMIDAFAFVIPIGMIIQRFGCLLAGCCYGRVTSVPWAIKYGATSHAFQRHTHENLIDLTSTSSLPVHPAQLYDMMGCLLILAALTCLKKHIRVSGNLFLTTTLLYGHVRFITEFFRVPTSGNFNVTGLTLVQVSLMFLIPFLLSLILIREKKIQPVSSQEKFPSPPGFHCMVFFIFVIFLFLLFSRWLSPLEIVTLNLVLLPTLAFIGWQIFKSLTVQKMRWFTGSLIACSLVMMAQTLPETAKNDSTKISYNILSGGTLVGSSNLIFANHDCSGAPVDSKSFHNSYRANALGISRVVQKDKHQITQFGIDGFVGRHQEEVDGTKTNDIALFGVHPYFQYDAKKVGFGLGFHVGRLSLLRDRDFEPNYQISSVRKINFYPSLYFRFGNINRFFVETKLAQQFPTSFPSLAFQSNVGIGFGEHNEGVLRIGTASYAGLFLTPSFPVGKNLIVEPYLGFFNGLAAFFDEENNFTGALTVRYKFNFKERPLQ